MPHSAIVEDDVIPYRCPKCGHGHLNGLHFPSLKSLRDHLEQEHSLVSKPSHKADYFGYNSNPIADTFNREAKELERQLRLAKEAEQRHRQVWNKLADPDYSALENVDREIRKSRADKQRLNDALEDAVDKIEQMRRDADILNEEQKDTVQKLHDRLALKEADLELLKTQLRALTDERSKLEKDKKELSNNSRNKEGLIQVLRAEIQDKETQLSDRQRDVDDLSQFLKDTAQKEAVARKKLEDFIEGLMERAETAEQNSQHMQRCLAMTSNEGIEDDSNPLLPSAIPRELLPMGPRRQMPATDLSWSTNDILNSTRPHTSHQPSYSALDRSQSADALVPSTSLSLSGLAPFSAQPSSSISQMASAPKPPFHGDKTSDYGSMSSYAVTSPKSQTLDRDMNVHNVTDDIIREEPNMPMRRDELPKAYLQQNGDPHLIQNGHHGNGLDVDEHGIMWDRESGDQDEMHNGQAVQRSSSNVSSQPSTVTEINRNTEQLLSQQRAMLNNQLTFLSKQQEVLEHGFNELRTQQQQMNDEESLISDTDDESTAVEEGSTVFESETETEHECSVIEYQPKSSLHSAGPIRSSSPFSDGRAKRSTPKRIRARFNARGHKNSDIKQMVTTTLWAVPKASPESQSPLRTNVNRSPNLKHLQSPQLNPLHSHLPAQKPELEALFCVFLYLDVFSLARAAQVCRTWCQLTQIPALWRKVYLANTTVSPKCLNCIAKHCTEMSHLTLSGIRGPARRRNEDINEYRRRTKGSLEEGLESVIRTSGGALKKLEVIDCGNLLTDRCLWLASCYSRNIADVTYISDTDPAGSEVIWSLGAGCRQITRFIVPPMYPNQNPHKFTNHCAFNIARCWPDLHSLSIGGVDVTTRGLAAIAHFCGKLQRLELDHMCEVTEDMAIAMCRAGLKGLRALHLTFTPVTPKALLQFTSACPYLNDISVRVGISDYYEDTDNPEHREEFATIISKLRKLQHRPGFERKLHLNVDYGPPKLKVSSVKY